MQAEPAIPLRPPVGATRSELAMAFTSPVHYVISRGPDSQVPSGLYIAFEIVATAPRCCESRRASADTSALGFVCEHGGPGPRAGSDSELTFLS